MEVDREVVLPTDVVGQFGSLGVAAQAAVEQRVGKPPGAVGDLLPGEPPVAKNEAVLVRPRRSDCFMDRCERYVDRRGLGHLVVT